MPELKRNFMQGRMNKDLDERLVGDGEYRDAMNIQVSTAEGSDIGSARNIPSNKSLGLLKYPVPYYKLGPSQVSPSVTTSSNVNTVRGGLKNDSIKFSSNSVDIISPNAEVVGAITDDRENKIYSLIANATDLETRPVSEKTTNGDIDSGSGTTYVIDTDVAASIDVGDVVVGTGTTDVLQGTTVVSVEDLGSTTSVVLSKSHTTLAAGDTLQFHTAVQTGRKSDVILEYTPDAFVSGSAEMKPVFVDIYEVVADLGQSGGDGSLSQTFSLGFTNHNANKREDVDYEHTGLSNLSNANGIIRGMKVDAVDINGDSLWTGTYNGVFVDDVSLDGTGPGGVLALGQSPTKTKVSIALNKKVILTQAQIQAGATLKFTKERILNFKTGTSYSYQDARLTPQTVSSYTPISTKVTGLDIIDDMLFMAQDNDEPKKINITKGKQGSLAYSSNLGTPDFYNTTRYIYDADNNGGNGNVSIKETMKKDDVTVCKLGPLTAPKLWMRDTNRTDSRGRDANVNNITLAGLESQPITGGTFLQGFNEGPGGNWEMTPGSAGEYSFRTGVNDSSGNPTIKEGSIHTLFVSPRGGYAGTEVAYFDVLHKERWPYYDDSGNEQHGWRIGDVLSLYCPIKGWKVKASVDGVSSRTFEDDWGETHDVINSVNLKLISANDEYLKAKNPGVDGAEFACYWQAYLEEDIGESTPGRSVLYRDKFVRFAYRYRYNDGEISPLSPFSLPAFIPAAPFIFNGSSDGNEAMYNNLKWLAITDFLGGGEIRDVGKYNKRKGSYRPIDIKSIDILYKEDGNTNVYLLKNIDKGRSSEGTLDSLDAPNSNWWHTGFLGGDHQLALGNFNPYGEHWDSSKRGFYKVTGDFAGRVIPEMQVFRPFDDVPRNVKAQCVSSSRIIYANYKTQYDLVDKFNEKVNITFGSVDGRITEDERPIYGFHGLSVHNSKHWTKKGNPDTSIKRERSYTVGIVFKDRFGRESSVVLGKQNSITLKKNAHRSGLSCLKLHVQPFGNIPHWAEYYKYFIKESSNEYYNLPLHAYFPSLLTKIDLDGVAKDIPSEVWLVFDSEHRNKVQEDTVLMLTKQADHYGGHGERTGSKYPILAISNEAPNPFKDGNGDNHPDPELPENVDISHEDKKGKFFVKVKLDLALWAACRRKTGTIIYKPIVGNSVVFETVPDPVSADLNIFYEASDNRPINLYDGNIEDYISVGDIVFIQYRAKTNIVPDYLAASGTTLADLGYDGRWLNVRMGAVWSSTSGHEGGYGDPDKLRNRVVAIKGAINKGDNRNRIVTKYGNVSSTTSGANSDCLFNIGSQGIPTWAEEARAVFTKPDGSRVEAFINLRSELQSGAVPPNEVHSGASAETLVNYDDDSINYTVTHNSVWELKANTWQTGTILPWFNCYSFENSVEADKIGDKFNAVKLDRGVKVSAPSPNYQEQERKHGLTFSGLYNSKNGVNNLNQFIAAEGITKDLNPEYGSIQKLFSRNTDIVAFCEDKVLKILSSKDALFNADGNTALTATNRVLGQTIPFSGDYGISTNPESFAENEFRCYFTDRARGAVLRLSRDGITKISDVGMKNYFADNLKSAVAIVGSFNDRKSEYDITIHSGIDTASSTKSVSTISFNEDTNGWVSFRGYALEQGLSLNNTYYTFKGGELYEHGVDPGSAARNNFYGIQYYSSVTPVFNDVPASIKSFNLLNYEGTQARVIEVADDDPNAARTPDQNYQQYYNNTAKVGWYVEEITTDQQTGKVLEFKEKEGKWFNKVQGEATTWSNTLGGGAGSGSGNLDSQELSFQGVGIASGVISTNPTAGTVYTITATMSQTGGSNAPTIVGDSDSIINGGNANTITSTVTLTAANGFVLGDINLDADALAAVSGITPSVAYDGTTYDVSTDLPTAGQTSVTITITYSSATVGGNVAFDLGFTMTSLALIEHQLNLILEYQNSGVVSGYQEGLTQDYIFSTPTTSNADYTIGLASDTTSAVDSSYNDAVFSITATSLNPTLGSQEIASFSLTAGANSSFTAANNTSLSSLHTAAIVTDLATNQGKLLFEHLLDATSGTTGLALSNADNRYNVTTTPAYDNGGNITAILVKIFYNPLASTAAYTNIDTLRIPYLTINSISIPAAPPIIVTTKPRVIIEVNNDTASNTFSFNQVASQPFGMSSPTVHTGYTKDHNDEFIEGGGYVEVNSDGPLATASPAFVGANSPAITDYLGIGSNVDIYLQADAGKYINVSEITSWMGIADNTNATTQSGHYKNIKFYPGDPDAVSFFNGMASNLSFVTNEIHNSLLPTLGNAGTTFDMSNFITDVTFTDSDPSNTTSNSNNVIMNIAFDTNARLCGDTGSTTEPALILPAHLATDLANNELPNTVIPTPAIADNNATVTTNTGTNNHRFRLDIDELTFLSFKAPINSLSQHTYSSENVNIGFKITQTEQTNYDAYNFNAGGEPAVLGSDATLSTQTLDDFMTSGDMTNYSYGLRGNPGTFYNLTIEGTYSSGDTNVHRFKYDTAGIQVDSTDLEIVKYDEGTGQAASIANQASLNAAIGPANVEALVNANTQLNSYKLDYTGTFSAGRCTAVEVTIIYNDDSTGVHTDADYHIDPLVVSPSRPRRSALCFRKIS